MDAEAVFGQYLEVARSAPILMYIWRTLLQHPCKSLQMDLSLSSLSVKMRKCFLCLLLYKVLFHKGLMVYIVDLSHLCIAVEWSDLLSWFSNPYIRPSLDLFLAFINNVIC